MATKRKTTTEKTPDPWFFALAREMAKQEFHDAGAIEIDDDAFVAMAPVAEPHGAYVQAWVWVEFPLVREDRTA